ncbi:MAG: sulfotransferase domain-containing protein [Phenylobacterium sp.]
MGEIIGDWPRKTRELQNHHMDSTLWDGFEFSDDDVIVATYAKSGTTWMQQIVGQLVYQGDESVAVGELSPWWDMRILPPEVREAVVGFPGRRIMKTHLPADALVLSPKAKYIYVGRDGRDIGFSLHNHHLNHSELAFELINNTPGRVGPPLPKADPDLHRYFNHWLETDGGDHWSLSENLRSWWALRDLPNVKLVHFANLKADLAGQMREIADFLGIDVPPAKWPQVVEHCTFDWMKAHAVQVVPLGGMPWEGGAATFMNKGTNGRWKDVLTPAESAAYERLMVERVGADCAHWLATGEGA